MTISGIRPVLQGPEFESEELYANIKPVRYRYVLAYLHQEVDADGVLHKPGEMMYVLPMLNTNYGVGIYRGTEMAGDLHLPTFYLHQMPHPPDNAYERLRHPDQGGIPMGAAFECGNRAIYVMRNEEVVWGGILWSRDYTSGSPTMRISAVSFDAYLYHRVMRRTIYFKPPINQYIVWYAVMKAALTDFTWSDPHDGIKTSHAAADAKTVKRTKKRKGHPSRIISTTYTYWTGVVHSKMNAEPINYIEEWPYNTPRIELPPQSLRLYSDYPKNKKPVKSQKGWRGYDLQNMGEALEEWADTATIFGGKRCEYRVVCYYDATDRRFKQRYIFGEMKYGTDPNTPTAIIRARLGANTQTMAKDPDNVLSFDFPGQISSWSLTETMEGCVTRVIASNQAEKALKHAEYACDKDVLDRPNRGVEGSPRGSQGWLLYDKTVSYNIKKKIASTLRTRATNVLKLLKVPTAGQINDFANKDVTQRASLRSTDFKVTLYNEPTSPLPNFKVGDWAAFNIEDPFYGGKMHLVRRIMGYTVNVVGDQESDYSHETIELELTDDSEKSFGE